LNERYWRTDQELFGFLRTIEDVSRSSINLSGLIFSRFNVIIDSFTELRVTESSGSLARDKIFWISSLVSPSLERSDFSYDANLDDSSLIISSGTFALDTASLNSEDEEKDLIVDRDVFLLHLGHLEFELDLDPKFLPHWHLSITQIPPMNLNKIRGTRG